MNHLGDLLFSSERSAERGRMGILNRKILLITVVIALDVILYLCFPFNDPLSPTSIILMVFFYNCISPLFVSLCFYVGTRQFRVDVSLFISMLAFIISFFGGMGIAIGFSEKRIIYILGANPQCCWEWVQATIFFIILPSTVSLAYSIIAFIKDEEFPTWNLKKLLPMVVGGLFIWWGSMWASIAFADYSDAINRIIPALFPSTNPVEISDIISKICLPIRIGLFFGV
ncbi:MAG: hypothetical protein ACPLW8_03955 [Candidatus Bathyarchaeales archaeon]